MSAWQSCSTQLLLRLENKHSHRYHVNLTAFEYYWEVQCVRAWQSWDLNRWRGVASRSRGNRHTHSSWSWYQAPKEMHDVPRKEVWRENWIISYFSCPKMSWWLMLGLQDYIYITIILKMLMESQVIFILCTSVISFPISHKWERAPSLETDS